MIVHQAYRFALDPTPRQQGALASHVGGARFAYNWGLELVKRRLEERAAGQDVEVPWTLPTLRRAWNRAKDGVAPWWAENSKEAYSSGLDALASGLRNWADSKQGRRIVVVEEGETTDDLVRDMVEALTSFCARLYGRRGARNRAMRAVTATKDRAP